MRLTRLAAVALLCACACGNDKEAPPGGTQAPLPGEPISTGPADPPPNAPLPPAMCGDMNGGGDQHVDFPTMMATKVAEKDEAMARQLALLEERYDLSNEASSATRTRGKPLQAGVRVKLPKGLT